MFHIHQIHFVVIERNKIPVVDLVWRDTVPLEFWSGNVSEPYPSMKLRLYFSGDIAGDFVYHCHLLEHEDKGMMAGIRVLPALGAGAGAQSHSLQASIALTFVVVPSIAFISIAMLLFVALRRKSATARALEEKFRTVEGVPLLFVESIASDRRLEIKPGINLLY